MFKLFCRPSEAEAPQVATATALDPVVGMYILSFFEKKFSHFLKTPNSKIYIYIYRVFRFCQVSRAKLWFTKLKLGNECN